MLNVIMINRAGKPPRFDSILIPSMPDKDTIIQAAKPTAIAHISFKEITERCGAALV